MIKNKLIDCVTFFDNNFMFNLRYNILERYVDYFVICESYFDHRGKVKGDKFITDKNQTCSIVDLGGGNFKVVLIWTGVNVDVMF